MGVLNKDIRKDTELSAIKAFLKENGYTPCYINSQVPTAWTKFLERHSRGETEQVGEVIIYVDDSNLENIEIKGEILDYTIHGHKTIFYQGDSVWSAHLAAKKYGEDNYVQIVPMSSYFRQ